LKKGHQGVIVQLCSLYVQTSKPSIPLYLQGIIDKHSKVFEDIPIGIPPTHDHDHAIHLIPGSVPPNIRPYRYPYAQKSEIERMVEEMLEVGIIRPKEEGCRLDRLQASWCKYEITSINLIAIRYSMRFFILFGG
jgi:hypothetical protein